MRSGSLRYRVALQAVTETRDAVGGVVQTWATVAMVWANRRTLRGQEYFAAAAIQAKETVQWRIRYRAGVVPKMRLLHEGRIYDIQGVSPDERNRELVLMTVTDG